jgi:hypothetical protein
MDGMQPIVSKPIHHAQSAAKWVTVFNQSMATSFHSLSSSNISRRDAGLSVENSVVLRPDFGSYPTARHKQFGNSLITSV